MVTYKLLDIDSNRHHLCVLIVNTFPLKHCVILGFVHLFGHFSVCFFSLRFDDWPILLKSSGFWQSVWLSTHFHSLLNHVVNLPQLPWPLCDFVKEPISSFCNFLPHNSLWLHCWKKKIENRTAQVRWELVFLILSAQSFWTFIPVRVRAPMTLSKNFKVML